MKPLRPQTLADFAVGQHWALMDWGAHINVWHWNWAKRSINQGNGIMCYLELRVCRFFSRNTQHSSCIHLSAPIKEGELHSDIINVFIGCMESKMSCCTFLTYSHSFSKGWSVVHSMKYYRSAKNDKPRIGNSYTSVEHEHYGKWPITLRCMLCVSWNLV